VPVDETERLCSTPGSDGGVMIRRGSRFRYRRVIRVLVVTGDLEHLARLTEAFGRQGIELVPVIDGRGAITEIARSHASIDAVVIDPDLTDVTSEEVIAVVRATDCDLAVVVRSTPAAEVVEQVLELLHPT
jgi:DNA-binding response OmpR family regulator